MVQGRFVLSHKSARFILWRCQSTVAQKFSLVWFKLRIELSFYDGEVFQLGKQVLVDALYPDVLLVVLHDFESP